MAPKPSSLSCDRPVSPPSGEMKSGVSFLASKLRRSLDTHRSLPSKPSTNGQASSTAHNETTTTFVGSPRGERSGSLSDNKAAQTSCERRLSCESVCYCSDDGKAHACRSCSQSSQLSNTSSRCSSGQSSVSSLYGRVALEDYELLELPEHVAGDEGEDTHVEIRAIAPESVDIAAARAAHRRSNSQGREAVCERSPALSLAFLTRRDTRSALPLPPLPNSEAEQRKTHVRRQSTDSCSSTDEPLSEQQGPSKLSRDLRELDAAGWYWGPLCRKDAEKKLAGTAEGTFLLRDSSDRRHLFALSVRVGEKEVRHYLVKHSSQGYSWYEKSSRTSEAWGLTRRVYQRCCPSLVQLVAATVEASKRSGQREKSEICLLYPKSRFAPVPSLQHFARFTIRRGSGLTIDNVDRLPLPTSVKAFLKEPSVY